MGVQSRFGFLPWLTRYKADDPNHHYHGTERDRQIAREHHLESESRSRRRRPLSPLMLRIVAVNVLALGILVGGLLYLGRYQDNLIQTEIQALGTETRIMATALGEGAVSRSGHDSFTLSPELARPMLQRLVDSPTTRTVLFNQDGRLLSDSHRLGGPGGVVQVDELPPPPTAQGPLERLQYTVLELVDHFPNRDYLPDFPGTTPEDALEHPDTARAIAGESSVTAWRRPDGRIVFTAAAPVQRYREILGAVLVVRDGAAIDDAIRSVRLDILTVFGIALAITLLLSFYLARAIGRPIRRLAAAAERVRRGHGRQFEIPDFTKRHDEIGDLSGSLRDMTSALWARMDAIERFAADVSHELKNPLTSLRSAVETAANLKEPAQQARLMQIIQDDVERLDRLITDISSASRLDSELSRADTEPTDIGEILQMLVDIHETTRLGSTDETEDGEAPAPREASGPRLVLEGPIDDDLIVYGIHSRLVQVMQNVIANALSFSPPDGVVTLRARRNEGMIEVEIEDQGPGIPPGSLRTIFDRFYSERPAAEKFGTHSGLGLSISKQIIDAHGGEIIARNRYAPDGTIKGAVFTIRLNEP